MTNVVLLILSVVIYAWIWQVRALARSSAARRLFYERTGQVQKEEFVYYPDFRGFGRRLAIMVLLCMPFNIGGNIFTVLGNAQSDQSIYSVFSLYQDAKEDACTFGPTVYQYAGHHALGISFTLYQRSENKAYGAFVFNQFARHKGSAVFGGYQYAGSETFAVLAGHQQVGEEHRSFALFSTLESKTQEDKKK